MNIGHFEFWIIIPGNPGVWNKVNAIYKVDGKRTITW